MANNVERDVVTLLIRGLLDKFKADPERIRELSERDYYKRKEDKWSAEVQKLQAELQDTNERIVDFDRVQTELEEAQGLINEL